MEAPAVRLTVVGPSGTAVSVRLVAARLRIGRDAENEVHLPDAEASRLHAELTCADGAWTLRDLGSRNGTRLNGRAIEGPARVVRGDEIGVGRCALLFDATAGEADASRPTRVLPAPPPSHGMPGEPVGSSPALRAAVETVRRVAAADVSVLVLGENGTGKERIAQLLHAWSPRAAAPLVAVNCPALPGALLESELFGVERGVATGVEARAGIFESARGGTVLLDEIGDMEPAAQAKILRVLETRRIERVGGRTPVDVDVRVVAATHHDLRADVERGAFRRDLYYRLNTVTVRLPPLRERPEDLPALVAHFLAASARPDAVFSRDAMDALLRHAWPGNVRELKHAVERACLLAAGPEIGVADLPEDVRAALPPDPGAASACRVDDLLDRLVAGEAGFWDAVAEPYLRRSLARDDVRRLVAAARARAGGSYKSMAALLRIGGEYKRLVNFLNHHDLGA